MISVRVRRCVERLESFGHERVDAVVSVDLLLEASALLRGLEQSLMLREWELKAAGIPPIAEFTYEDLKPVAQQMIATARARYRMMARPLIHDDETQQQADAIERAIGEVSPEQAIYGLLRWIADTGRQPDGKRTA